MFLKAKDTPPPSRSEERKWIDIVKRHRNSIHNKSDPKTDAEELRIERDILYRKLCQGVTELKTFENTFTLKFGDIINDRGKLWHIRCNSQNASDAINDFMRSQYDERLGFTRYINDSVGIDLFFHWYNKNFVMTMMEEENINIAIDYFIKASYIFDIDIKNVGLYGPDHISPEGAHPLAAKFLDEVKSILSSCYMDMSDENVENMLSLII